jgi:hypothetical protein
LVDALIVSKTEKTHFVLSDKINKM